MKTHQHDRVIVYAILWLISYVISLFTIKSFPSLKEAGVVLLLITTLAFAVFIYKYYRSIFFMDEVQIKIHMEAAVIGFSLGLCLIMILGLSDLITPLSKENWGYRHVFPFLVIFYFLGLFIAKKKYAIGDEKHD